MSNSLRFGVIEAPWGKKSTYSARPLFDVFSHVITGKIDSYDYKGVVGPASFEEAFTRQLRQKLQYILISGHGGGGDLIFPQGKRVRAASIKAAIDNVNFQPFGLIVDACEFATRANAETILSTGVTWLASYEKTVKWLESASLVLLFCTTLRYQQGNERLRAKKTMNFLRRKCGGLTKKLGFRLYLSERSKPFSVW